LWSAVVDKKLSRGGCWYGRATKGAGCNVFVEKKIDGVLTYAFRTSTRSRTRDCDSSIDGAVCSESFESLRPFTLFWASMLSSRFRFAESRMASLLADRVSVCCGGGLKTPLTEAMANGLCCLQYAA
jgi:hypothetical protein